MRELLKKLATPDKLLACTSVQLDGILLAAISDRIKRSEQDPIAPQNISLPELQGMYPVGPGVTFITRSQADIAITEAWHRLINGGFLMQSVGQSSGVMTLTSKGIEAARYDNFEEIVVRQTLAKEMLHIDLRGSVYDNFAAGHYDTAVLDAFKLVEDAVRNAATGLAPGLVGASLMRQAYDPQNGPLTNQSLHRGERAAMPELFAGAMGVFRNPVAHRRVGKSDPATVMEELMIASRLLRFVKP